VRPDVLGSPSLREQALTAYSPLFDHAPVVLMAQDLQGIPTFFGRPDIVNFLRDTPLDAIPWQEFTTA
jgi:hypothetical protein